MGDSCSRKFRFAFKVLRIITHDHRLKNAGKSTDDFVDSLHILDGRRLVGPSFSQLPPDFAPDRFLVLEHYTSFVVWALEVRHADSYDEGANESQLDEFVDGIRNRQGAV